MSEMRELWLMIMRLTEKRRRRKTEEDPPLSAALSSCPCSLFMSWRMADCIAWMLRLSASLAATARGHRTEPPTPTPRNTD